MALRTKLSVWWGITGTKVTNLLAVQGSILKEEVGFKDSNFSEIFNDTYPMIKDTISFGARKTDKKMQALLNFH
jgi:hypothetical protein